VASVAREVPAKRKFLFASSSVFGSASVVSNTCVVDFSTGASVGVSDASIVVLGCSFGSCVSVGIVSGFWLVDPGNAFSGSTCGFWVGISGNASVGLVSGFGIGFSATGGMPVTSP